MAGLAFLAGAGCRGLQRGKVHVSSRQCSAFGTAVQHKKPVAARSTLRMVATEPDVETNSAEKFEFQAEAHRVMDLVINSLYSNKDIFLRELISNASDACDKRRLLQLTDNRDSANLDIRVRADKAAQTLTIEDKGVGMTKKELIENLGSIATSGTAKFVEALGKGTADTSLIGQFGVGFYSAFLVSDKVTVYSKSFTDKNSPVLKWDAENTSSYTIEEDSSVDLGESGTRIVLHIKDGNQEFLEHRRISTLLKRFSEFIDFSIYAWDEQTVMEEVPDGDEKDEEGNQKMKKVPKTVEDWKLINEQKPIWLRRPKEVTDEEYNDFYKSMSRDFNDPVAHTHFTAEGEVEFRAILYTPSVLPYELRQNMFDDAGRIVKLYVKRVFISDKFQELMPRWLTFVRGVIDSEDLPLNVSREILQQSRVLRIISKRLIRKSIDMFNEIAEDEEKYSKFWTDFGRYLKAGIIDEADYVEPISQLLRFDSSKSKGLTSLQAYVERMPQDQKEIFYVSAESTTAAANSPICEKLNSRGFEVIYLVDAIDEICIQTLQKFKGKRSPDAKDKEEFSLADISRDDFKTPGGEDEEEDEKKNEEFNPVTEYMKAVLGSKVSKVQVSTRLTESPSAIVQSQYGMSPNMERFMKAQMSANETTGGLLEQSRILEINATHPIVVNLRNQLAQGEDDEMTKDTVRLLHELGLMSGGYSIEDSAGFSKRIARMLASGITQAPPPPASDSDSDLEEADADGEDTISKVESEIVE